MSVEELRARVEADEKWLASLGVEVPPPAGLLERAKERVRLAIDEAASGEEQPWFAAGVRVEPPPEVLASVKQAVARELAAMRRSPAATRWGTLEANRVYRLFSTTAAVASLLFAAGLGVWSAITAVDRPSSTYALADLVEVMGRGGDPDEAEWLAIESELTALETALADNAAPNRDRGLFEELGEEIDVLTNDIDHWPEGGDSAG